MPDKSFEQQIKAQLADLRMKPDDAVWLDVAAALHKERKRRWLIWLFLLAGCSGASFWAYYQFGNPEQQPIVNARITANPKEQTSKENNRDSVTEKTQKVKQVQPSVSGKIPVIKKAEKTNRLSTATIQDKKILATQSIKQSPDNLAANNNAQVPPVKQDAVTTTLNTDKITVIENPVAGIEKSSVIEKTATATGSDTINTTTKQQAPEKKILPRQPAVTADTVVTLIKKTTKNDWQWNIAVDAGSSGIRSLGSNKVDNVFAANNPSSSSGSALGQTSTMTPVINDASSAGLQLQATKQVGKKNSIGLSLGYSLFQTGTSVGRRIDSTTFFNGFNVFNTNGYYFSSTDSVGYTNQYHFLRAGFDFYRSFRLFKTMQMRWQLGTGLDIMIATNGLNYDANSGRLFRNSAVMTTVQTHLSTGFDIAVGKRPFMYIGPHWQYFISNLSKQTGTDQHVFLSAVKVSLILPKNKK